MNKDFKNALNKSSELKISALLKTENQKLKESLKAKNDKIEELRAVIQQKENDLPVNEMPLNLIKLIDNIRSDIEPDAELEDSIKKIGQLEPVIVTKDNYLIAGYRRFHSIKNLGKRVILVSIYPKFLHEIKKEVSIIQFEENERRQNLDNFDISKLFNSYINEGLSQKELVEIFQRTKGYVSSIITITNILPELKKILKEIQKYGYSFEKYSELKAENKIIENEKNIIGWKPLYAISKHKEPEKQINSFLQIFKNKISDNEKKKFGYKEKIDNEKIQKFQASINKKIDSFKKDFTGPKNQKILNEVEKLIEELNQKLNQLS